MAKILGNNLLLQIVTSTSSADTPVRLAHAESAGLTMNRDMPESTSIDSNQAKEVLPGMKSYELSFDGKVDFAAVSSRQADKEIGDFLVAGTLLEWSFGEAANVWTGTGYVQSYNPSGTRNNVATYSGSIMVTGDITTYTRS